MSQSSVTRSTGSSCLEPSWNRIRIHTSTLNKGGGRIEIPSPGGLQPSFELTGNRRPSQQLKYKQLAPPIFGLKKVQRQGGLKAPQGEQLHCCLKQNITFKLSYRYISFVLEFVLKKTSQNVTSVSISFKYSVLSVPSFTVLNHFNQDIKVLK